MKKIGSIGVVMFVLASALVYTLIFRIDFVCENVTNRLGCYGGNLDFRLNYFGSENSRNYLVMLQQKNLLSQGECHTLAHEVGRQSAKAGFSMVEAMESENGFCGWGFFHGVMEGLFGKDAGHGRISVEARKLCESISSGDRLGQFNCFHALGHGFYYIDGNLINSLKRCDDISGEGGELCRDGVFMADMFVPDGRYSLDMGGKPGDKCVGLSADYRKYCYWRAVPMGVFGASVGIPDRDKIVAVAGNIPAGFRALFWNGLGRELDSRTASNELEIKSVCGIGDGFKDCIMGAGWHMVFYDKGDEERSRLFCRNALGEKDADRCLSISGFDFPGLSLY